jgi:hypothetical protein
MSKFKGNTVEEGHKTNKYRKPSVTERAAAEELFKKIERARKSTDDAVRKLKDLEKTCKHVVFYDVAGFPYDSRWCGSCGKLLETI